MGVFPRNRQPPGALPAVDENRPENHGWATVRTEVNYKP